MSLFLTLKKNKEIDTESLIQFAEYLLPIVKESLEEGSEKLKPHYNKIRETLQENFPKGVSIEQINEEGINHLECVLLHTGDVRIQIESQAHIGKLNVVQAIRSIEFGSKGTPLLLFRQVFDDMEKDQKQLYEEWQEQNSRMVRTDVFV